MRYKVYTTAQMGGNLGIVKVCETNDAHIADYSFKRATAGIGRALTAILIDKDEITHVAAGSSGALIEK